MESKQFDEKAEHHLGIPDKNRKNPVEYGLRQRGRRAVFHGTRVEIDDNL